MNGKNLFWGTAGIGKGDLRSRSMDYPNEANEGAKGIFLTKGQEMEIPYCREPRN